MEIIDGEKKGCNFQIAIEFDTKSVPASLDASFRKPYSSR